LCSDERLAKLVSGGSERALTVLYERHHQALYRYCRSILRDDDDAQDALQSTMTHAFLALRASERDVAVRPWLFRIAHNEAVSILRKRRHADPLEEEHERSEVSVERTVDQRERLRLLVADIQALPERQRAALLMRELSGLSIEEIAAALSVSQGAAKQTLFEARSSLQEFAEGRAMECEPVRRAISDGDGRVLRGRRMRAHLRGCEGCRDFRALIDTRTADLRALVPPLPAGAAAAMLGRVLVHGTGGGHGAGTAAASGAALGSHAGASLLVKGLVGAVVLAAASAGTLHLVRGPAEHEHTSRALAPDAAVAAGVADRASVAEGDAGPPAAVARTPRTRSIGSVRVAHPHVSPGRGSPVSTGVGSEASRTVQSPAIAAAGQPKSSSRPSHGSTGIAHRTSGKASHGSKAGQLSPPRPKHSHRSHRPSKPVGPSSAPQSGNRPNGEKQRGPQRESHGNGRSPQAHQAPAGQPPAAAEKRNEAHQQTTAPATPLAAAHGHSG
jgi:RNA polymerase sigma factor (sigma-70 family)